MFVPVLDWCGQEPNFDSVGNIHGTSNCSKVDKYMGGQEGAHLEFPSWLLARMGITQKFGNVSGWNEDFGAVLGEEE